MAYLLVFGELPDAGQLAAWTEEITLHTMVHENIKKLMEAFRYDAHPMGMFLSTIGALSTFYPDAKQIGDIDVAPPPDAAPHRQGADHRRLRLSPLARVCPTSCRTTS